MQLKGAVAQKMFGHLVLVSQNAGTVKRYDDLLMTGPVPRGVRIEVHEYHGGSAFGCGGQRNSLRES